MATIRSLRTVRPLHYSLHSSSARSSGEVRWINRKRVLVEGEERKSKAAVAKASMAAPEGAVIPEPRVGPGIGVSSFALDTVNALSRRLKQGLTPRLDTSQLQTSIERGMIDCRFFTLFAVAGSLLGSISCFVEGCFLVLQTYMRYTHVLSQGSNEHLIQLLIEAIDMFLVGTSMLTFGMALYGLFVGSRSINEKLPSWAKIDSVLHAKSKVAHAVVMILHVGMLEKLKSIPLVTCLDLACFAGSVFISSAGMFLLSNLSRTRIVPGEPR